MRIWHCWRSALRLFCRKKLPCRELEKRNLIELANMERRDPEKKGSSCAVHSLMPQFRRRVLCVCAHTNSHSDGAHTLSGRFCELCDRNQAAVREKAGAHNLRTFFILIKTLAQKYHHVTSICCESGMESCAEDSYEASAGLTSLSPSALLGGCLFIWETCIRAHPHVAPKEREKLCVRHRDMKNNQSNWQYDTEFQL
jgi:hypothetical protein